MQTIDNMNRNLIVVKACRLTSVRLILAKKHAQCLSRYELHKIVTSPKPIGTFSKQALTDMGS